MRLAAYVNCNFFLITETTWLVFLDRYFERSFESKGRLGKGGFGHVIQAKHKLDGQTYAIKTIHICG